MVHGSHHGTARSEGSRSTRHGAGASRGTATTTVKMATTKKARHTALTRQTLDNTAHTSRSGPVRSTGNVIEDIFFTYTGCASMDDFLDLQAAGAALTESVVQGSAFTHSAVQPQVPPLLEAWLAHKKGSRPTATATTITTTTAAAASIGAGAPNKRALCSYASVPKAPAVLPRLAASLTGTSDLDTHSAGEPVEANTPLLPALEELPALQRCDRPAVDALRTLVDGFLRRLAHLIELTEALKARWGLLSESERLTLHNAMSSLTQSMVSRQALMNVFTQLTFRDEGLERASEELDDCTRVEALVLSENAGLTALEHIPPHADTLLASACRLSRIDFSALTFVPTLSVLGLAYNALQNLGFLSQLPSLRILDVSHNELCDMPVVTEDIAAHSALEEVTLLGNPLALVEGYRRLVGSACANVRTLDGFVLQSREREAFTLADYTQYEQHVHPPPPPSTIKKSTNEAKRRASQPSVRGPADRLSHQADTATALATKSERGFVDVEDEYEHSVEATAEVLQITGLTSLLDQPVSIAAEEELQPFSALVLEAAGLRRTGAAVEGSPEQRAWRLPASVHGSGGVPALERVLASLPGGGPPVLTAAHALVSDDPSSARLPRRRPIAEPGELSGVSTTAAGDQTSADVSGASSPLRSSGVNKRAQTGKVAQRVPLYEIASVLTLRGAWAAPELPSEAGLSEAADEGVAVHVRAFDSAEHQVDAALGSGLALLQASMPVPPSAAGADQRPVAASPPPSHQGARQGPVSKLRKAVAATVVEDAAVLNATFTRDLPLTPRLVARLRQPIVLEVTVQDTVLVWNTEARRALLEGGGPGAHKALQKAVACSLTPASSEPAPPPRPGQSGRSSYSSGGGARAAGHATSETVATTTTTPTATVEPSPAEASAASSLSTAGSPLWQTASPPPVRPVVETRCYHVGTFTLHPQALLAQNTHLRPPRAAPVPTLQGTRASPHGAGATNNGNSAAASSHGNGSPSSKKGVARPTLDGPAAELPCARELFARDIALARSAKDAEEVARDVARAQADLCACLEAYATAYEHVALARKDVSTHHAAGGPSPSISLAGTLHSNSGLFANTLTGAAAAATTTTPAHGRQRHGASALNSANGGGGRRQSVKPVSAEAVAAQQSQKSLEQWRLAVTDCAAHLIAAKARAAELQDLHLTLDVHLKLGRGPLPPLSADEEARQAPVLTREKSSKK